MSKLKTLDEVKRSNLPEYVEIPIEYYPKGVGPGGFSPQTMYMHALAEQKSLLHEHVMKSWVILWLLDHVDWSFGEKNKEIQDLRVRFETLQANFYTIISNLEQKIDEQKEAYFQLEKNYKLMLNNRINVK